MNDAAIVVTYLKSVKLVAERPQLSIELDDGENFYVFEKVADDDENLVCKTSNVCELLAYLTGYVHASSV